MTIGIQKVHPWVPNMTSWKKQAFQVEDFYLQLILYNIYKKLCKVIFYGTMLVFSGVLHWSQDPKAPRKALSPECPLRVPRNGPQRPRCRCMSWRPCTMWGHWEMSWSKFSGKFRESWVVSWRVSCEDVSVRSFLRCIFVCKSVSSWMWCFNSLVTI